LQLRRLWIEEFRIGAEEDSVAELVPRAIEGCPPLPGGAKLRNPRHAPLAQLDEDIWAYEAFSPKAFPSCRLHFESI
jgi:hypothetical protein